MSTVARGRYAPSPTGDIHLGNARTALVAWLSARAQGGQFLWRVEDIDRVRTVQGMEQRQINDLHWLGLDWDAGPGARETEPKDQASSDQASSELAKIGPHHQSQRVHLYVAALQRLGAQDRLFPCSLSRKDLRQIASAPHSKENSPYPPSLRPERVAPGWLEDLLQADQPNASVRFKVDKGRCSSDVDQDAVSFTDRIVGVRQEFVGETTGDFVLLRRDGEWAYQLAVVVDDALQGITEVVRGQDLIDSTARQILLQRALGFPTPDYSHVPLLVDQEGEKLSKRHDSLTLAALRDSGWRPEALVGLFAQSLGLTDSPDPIHPAALVSVFDWRRIVDQPTRLPNDFAQEPRWL